MDGPPLGSPRMSGETESEQRALRERRVERTEAPNVIVRTGSDRITECRIMSDSGSARINDAAATQPDSLLAMPPEPRGAPTIVRRPALEGTASSILRE